MRYIALIPVMVCLMLSACHPSGTSVLKAGIDQSSNPLIDGFYADPSIVIHDGVVYLYATKDPWGGRDLACFTTTDFRNWKPQTLNWPTKSACKSNTGTRSMVWAPSVVRATNGRFYMYVSVGGEIYCGVADHPLGPWSNVREDQAPIIRNPADRSIHAIDAEAFIDDDGKAYLYWGSGWNWVNGRCMAVELAPDMNTFIDEPREITPPNYFEAPFMIKRHGKYFLMYSDGKTIDDTYKVRYAVADHPLGPFHVEGENSPILSTDVEREVYGPGHHSVFSLEGSDYIAYHRHKRPFDLKTMLRQICIDPLDVRADGTIQRVLPTD